MKLVTTRFKSGGLHEKHVVACVMNISIFAIFVIQLLFILISSHLPLLFHLSRIPICYHFRLNPLFLTSSSTVYYYFLFLPLSYLITYSVFISSTICFYCFFSRFYYCLISFFHFYISFSSTFLFLHIDSPIPPPILSFLHSLFLLFTHHVLSLILLCMHSNLYLLLPFLLLLLLLLLIVLDLFSSHRNTLSSFFFFTPVPYFPLLPYCKLKRFLLFFVGYSYLLQYLSPEDISVLTKNIRNTDCIPWCQKPIFKAPSLRILNVVTGTEF